MVLLHGQAGSADELAIIVVAFVVLWLAVKLAGRPSAEGEEQGEMVERGDGERAGEESPPPATPRR